MIRWKMAKRIGGPEWDLNPIAYTHGQDKLSLHVFVQIMKASD